MADITISIVPGSALTRAVDAVCANHGYQATIDGQPNPETKNQFAKRMLAKWVKDQVVLYETSRDMNAVRITSQTSAESLDIT